jgi:CheY-like chemotaxis protein
VGGASEARSYMENTGEFKDASYFRRPDLIVSDFRLAGHTAMDFVQWLRSDGRFADVPLVVLSAIASRLDRAPFAGLGVDRFLSKTADLEALGAALQPVLPKGRKGDGPGSAP